MRDIDLRDGLFEQANGGASLAPGNFDRRDAIAEGGASGRVAQRDDAPKSLPASLTFPATRFRELKLQLDPADRALWCMMDPVGPPSFTPTMVRELNQLHHDLKQFVEAAGEPSPVKFYVMGSRIPSIYNMGGDLAYMIDAIRNRDREALRSYAYGCVEAVFNIWHGFNLPIVSICLVEGDALGGGLEGVICFNVIVAERGAKMGMPEVLFGSFPGMGAISFLSRRIGIVKTEKMIRSGRIYTAEEFHEMGIVDHLANPGEGAAEVRKYIRANSAKHALNVALQKSKRLVVPLPLNELQEITQLWVDIALGLEDADLRKMDILAKAQVRRLAKQATN